MNNDVVLKINFTLQFAMAYAFIIQYLGFFFSSDIHNLTIFIKN